MARDWTDALNKKRMEGRCRVCKSEHGLDAAHVVPRSLGGDEHPDATVPLCRTCHTRFDQHQLDLLPYLTKPEQAHAVQLVGMASAWHITTGQRPA